MTVYPALLGPTPPGSDPDAIRAAAEVVRSYCGWHIAPVVEETVTLDGAGYRHLFLPSLHVNAVSAVVENGVTLDPSAFFIRASFLRRPLGCWGYPDTSVTFTHGYDECPLDVRQVVVKMAQAGYASARLSSTTEGPFAATYAESARGEVGNHTDVLNRYRLVLL